MSFCKLDIPVYLPSKIMKINTSGKHWICSTLLGKFFQELQLIPILLMIMIKLMKINKFVGISSNHKNESLTGNVDLN